MNIRGMRALKFLISAEELTEDQNEAKQLENARASCGPNNVFSIGKVVGANDEDEDHRTGQHP